MGSLIFNKYEKIRRIAQGGMGDVYLARQKGPVGFDRLVILKSLRDELCSEQDFVDQFMDEARVAATLNHPNIVALYEVGEWEKSFYMAMEFIDGDDLSRLWYSAAKKGVGLPFQVTVQIVHDAALGLAHAHAARDVNGNSLNIVHRDISPQNIMVRGDGVTKVVDFGIAKAANRVTKTLAGTVKGKLQYMSPEQVQGEPLDGRSDQFSLGIVLWEMCTGKRLFKSPNEIDTINRILQLPIPTPSSVVPAFPMDLEHCILKMLDRDRNKRYRTCAQAAKELRTYLDNAARAGMVDVETFVQDILGEELRERVKDLTPMRIREEKERSLPRVSQAQSEGAQSGAIAPVAVPSNDGIYVQKAGGEMLTLPSMNAVQQAILAGHLDRNAHLLQQGAWVKMSDIPELQRFLEVANAVLTHERISMGAVPAPVTHARKESKSMVLEGAPGANYPGEEETFVLGELPLPEEPQAKMPELFGSAGVPTSDPLSPLQNAGAADPSQFPDITVPGAKAHASAPMGNPHTQLEGPAEDFNPNTQPEGAPFPEATGIPKLPSTLPVKEPVPGLAMDGEASAQWQLGAISEGHSEAVGVSAPKSRGAGLWILLGVVMVAVAAGVFLFLNPEYTEPYRVWLKGQTEKGPTPPPSEELLPETPPREVEKASFSKEQWTTLGKTLGQKRIEEQISLAERWKSGTLTERAASSILWTEASRRQRLEAHVLPKKREALLKDAESYRREAFSLATATTSEMPGNLWAGLAMASYQSERLAENEMTTEVKLLRERLDKPDNATLDKGERAAIENEITMLLTLHKGLRALLEGRKKVSLSDDKGDARVERLVLLLTEKAARKKNYNERVNALFSAESASALVGGTSDSPPVAESLSATLAAAKKAQAQGQNKDAQTLYRKALRGAPKNLQALRGLGWVYIDLRNHSGAKRVFQKALKVAPGDGEAMVGLAEAYRYSGETRSARRYYERYLKKYPEGSEATVAKNALSALPAIPKPKPGPRPLKEPKPLTPKPTQPDKPVDNKSALDAALKANAAILDEPVKNDDVDDSEDDSE